MIVPTPYTAGLRKHSGSGRDALGNTVQSWGEAVDMPVHWGSPGAMDEPGKANRDASAIEWTLCVPPGTDVGERDRVVWNGEEYDVSGRPRDWTQGPWVNPVAAVVIELERVEG